MADFGYSPQEGVTFYYDNRGKVTDLCINPNVKTVTICSRSSNSFVGSQFSLQDCKKQFPDVEVLRISSDIIDVCINNKMFPNVKNVYSESKYYKNDVRMLVRKYKNGSFALKNAFCAAAGDVIDLKGISIIDDNAFDGCMATDFVNIDDVSICRADAFTGSAIELNKRYKNGLQIFGSVLIGVQSGVFDIEIPSYVKHVKRDISFQDVKNVTINNADQLCFFNNVPLGCMDSLYEDTPCLYVKQDTALELYHLTGKQFYKDFLKKSKNSIIKRYFDRCQEKEIIDFLQFGFFASSSLDKFRKIADEREMSVLSAYILEELKKKAPKTTTKFTI